MQETHEPKRSASEEKADQKPSQKFYQGIYELSGRGQGIKCGADRLQDENIDQQGKIQQ